MSNEALLAVADSPADLPRLPRKFGRYRLFDFIGKGGMAEIFLARAETELGGARLCVVKEILTQFAEHPQFAEMLIFEAKLAAKLSHAHIVQVFDLGREDGHLFIAMEYVEGFDLNALLRRCTQNKVALPIEFALRIMADVLGALDYAHRRADDNGMPLGVVHRDVSPSNILISLEGEVKLCDFGIAHANELVTGLAPAISEARPVSPPPSFEEAIKGKAGYMSPEHARGEVIDARADVFAVGIVLWELLAGKRLYRVEAGRPALFEQARRADIKPFPDKGLPEEAKLRAIVEKALAPRREDRFPSAAAMLRELESYMSDAKMAPSPLKLGEWLVDRFGMATVLQRRAREKALVDSVRPIASARISTVSNVPPPAPLPQLSPLAISEPIRTEPMPISSPPAASAGAASGIMRAAQVAPKTTLDELPPPSLVAATVDLGPPSNEPARGKLAPAPSPAKRFAIVAVVLTILAVAWMFLKAR